MRFPALLVSLLLSGMAFSQKQLPTDVHRYVKQDTAQVPTEAQLKTLLGNIYAKAYKSLTVIERADVDKDIKEIGKDGSVLGALQLSTTANVLTATNHSPSVALCLSVATVQANPGNTLLLNNLGALLHKLDSLKPALKVLLYTKSLNNKSPILFTNLGNVLFEMYDDRNAEVFYNRALRIDDRFTEARQGLILCYLKRKDLQKAYEELLRGVTEVHFSPVSKKLLDLTKYSREKDRRKSDPTPPPPLPKLNPMWPEEKTPVPVEKLQLPDFPDWPSREAFFKADKALSNWNKEINAEYGKSQDDLMAAGQTEIRKLNEIMKLPLAEQQKEMKKITSNFRKDKLIYGVELLEFYFDDRLEKLFYQRQLNDKALSAKFDKSFKEWAGAYEAQAPEMMKKFASDPGKTAAWAVEKCKEKQVLIDNYYQDWRKMSKEWHNTTTDALREYWIYTEQYLNQSYDMNCYNEIDARRRMYVYSKMAVFSNIYPISAFAMNVMGLDLAGGLNGKCAEPPPPPEPEATAFDTKVPKGKGPDCPWKDGEKFKIGFGPASLNLDCTSFEIEYAEGIAGSYKYDFKDHETTIFLGGGIKEEFGVADFSAKAGGFVKINSKGDIIDMGLTAEQGSSLNFHGNNFGSSFGVTATSTGVKGDFGIELSRTVFN